MTHYPKPTDQECLDMMKMFRNGELSRLYPDDDEFERVSDELVERLSIWYPDLLFLMTKMSDEEALAKAKGMRKPILL